MMVLNSGGLHSINMFSNVSVNSCSFFFCLSELIYMDTDKLLRESATSTLRNATSPEVGLSLYGGEPPLGLHHSAAHSRPLPLSKAESVDSPDNIKRPSRSHGRSRSRSGSPGNRKKKVLSNPPVPVMQSKRSTDMPVGQPNASKGAKPCAAAVQYENFPPKSEDLKLKHDYQNVLLPAVTTGKTSAGTRKPRMGQSSLVQNTVIPIVSASVAVSSQKATACKTVSGSPSDKVERGVKSSPPVASNVLSMTPPTVSPPRDTDTPTGKDSPLDNLYDRESVTESKKLTDSAEADGDCSTPTSLDIQRNQVKRDTSLLVKDNPVYEGTCGGATTGSEDESDSQSQPLKRGRSQKVVTLDAKTPVGDVATGQESSPQAATADTGSQVSNQTVQ